MKLDGKKILLRHLKLNNMPEKNFGETTEFFGKTLFERITDEMKEKGFEFAGIESLTIWQMGQDSVFEEVQTQTL